MSTEAAQQVLSDSVDRPGLSIVTSTRTIDAPRRGSVYNAAHFAAAEPVHFLPLHDGRYLGVFRSHWTGATVGGHGPQSYSSHTPSTQPVAMAINAATGAPGPLQQLTSRLPGTRTINGACNYQDYLFTVGTCDGVAHLQFHRITRLSGLLLEGEELLPTINGVDFDMGCWIDRFWLVVAGVNPAGELFLAHKRWGRVGDHPRDNWGWEYFKPGRGWHPDPATLAPLADHLNTPLTTVGPVSSAMFRTRRFLATVKYADGNYSALMYNARGVDPGWRLTKMDLPSLGDDDTYLGGTLYLQPQLDVNLALSPIGDGCPFVHSVLLAEETDESMLTSWALCRLSAGS